MHVTAKPGHVITAWEPLSLHLSTLHHEYPPPPPPAAEVKMKQSFLSSVGGKEEQFELGSRHKQDANVNAHHLKTDQNQINKLPT